MSGKHHIQVEITTQSSEQQDILIALLSEEGFEGFEQSDDSLKAFINEDLFEENTVSRICRSLGHSFTISKVAERNWNQEWESGFSPVTVGNFAGVRASFHSPMEHVQHELVITPKMSFGTGHHATTYLMIANMELIPFQQKDVLDFGTGTGVLAVLAEKLGADSVLAIDNDPWSIENASENLTTNNCSKILLEQRDRPPDDQSGFDIILANINKHIILGYAENLSTLIRPGGVLLLSGLLAEDEDDVFRRFSAYSLHLVQTSVRNNWLCMKLSR